MHFGVQVIGQQLDRRVEQLSGDDCAARQQHQPPPDRFRPQDGEHDEHGAEGADLKLQAVLGGHGMGQSGASESHACEERLVFRGRHVLPKIVVQQRRASRRYHRLFQERTVSALVSVVAGGGGSCAF